MIKQSGYPIAEQRGIVLMVSLLVLTLAEGGKTLSMTGQVFVRDLTGV